MLNKLNIILSVTSNPPLISGILALKGASNSYLKSLIEDTNLFDMRSIYKILIAWSLPTCIFKMQLFIFNCK